MPWYRNLPMMWAPFSTIITKRLNGHWCGHRANNILCMLLKQNGLFGLVWPTFLVYVGIFCWKLPRRKTLVYERSPSSLLPCRVRWTNDWPIVLYICVGYGGDNWARADEPNRYVRCDWWPAPRVHHLRFVDFVWRMARVWCHGVWY
jgi:hypothetical protein